MRENDNQGKGARKKGGESNINALFLSRFFKNASLYQRRTLHVRKIKKILFLSPY